jgi:hypothetical protein
MHLIPNPSYYTQFSLLHLVSHSLFYTKSNPNPFIHSLYFPTRSPHASCGSFAVENSMHSSRAAFSSLQTQQGLGLEVFVSEGLLEAARLLTCIAGKVLGLVGLGGTDETGCHTW